MFLNVFMIGGVNQWKKQKFVLLCQGSEVHLCACFAAGSRPDSIPGQWSYTMGPCRGIELGDHLWLSRYLLLRLSEQFKVRATGKLTAK